MKAVSAEVREAAQALARGDLIGLPTETVYGLAADAMNPLAVAAIFKAKGRPANHPLIVHVADASQVPKFASHVPAFALKLMSAFWPGPLTLILPRLPGLMRRRVVTQRLLCAAPRTRWHWLCCMKRRA